MEGYCSTGRSPQRAVVSMEEEENIMHHVLRTLIFEVLVTVQWCKVSNDQTKSAS
jgi:hypothetical protein